MLVFLTSSHLVFVIVLRFFNSSRKMTSLKESRQDLPESSPTYCNCQDAANSHVYLQQRSYVRFNFSQLCRFTVSLPLIGLVICFVSANIFQQNDIHETHCRVNSLSTFIFTSFFFKLIIILICRSIMSFLQSVQSLELVPSVTSGGLLSPSMWAQDF